MTDGICINTETTDELIGSNSIDHCFQYQVIGQGGDIQRFSFHHQGIGQDGDMQRFSFSNEVTESRFIKTTFSVPWTTVPKPTPKSSDKEHRE